MPDCPRCKADGERYAWIASVVLQFHRRVITLVCQRCGCEWCVIESVLVH